MVVRTFPPAWVGNTGLGFKTADAWDQKGCLLKGTQLEGLSSLDSRPYMLASSASLFVYLCMSIGGIEKEV